MTAYIQPGDTVLLPFDGPLDSDHADRLLKLADEMPGVTVHFVSHLREAVVYRRPEPVALPAALDLQLAAIRNEGTAA